ILSILLGWGKNFMPFTDFFLDYIPGYNKFRAVSMTLVIAELTIPLLGFLGLYQIYQNPEILRDRQKYIWISFGLTGGLALLFYLLPTTFFNFFSQFELEQFNRIRQSNPGDASQIDLFLSQLEAIRISIFKSDAIRSFIFILLAAAILYLYSNKKIKALWLIAAITLLILIDMVPVAQRYLNNNNFVPKRKTENPFQLTQADKEILKDNDPNFRVLDLTKNIFNDASTSYYHHAIGGYHGAKLQRYQDMIDHYIQREIQEISAAFNDNPNLASINEVLAKQQVLNMLNTRYYIYSPSASPLKNVFAFGDAWFAENIEWVQTPNEEIDALEAANLSNTAVLHDEFQEMLSDFDPNSDSTATIRLTHYAPNKLNYTFKSGQNQLVIFSEIWTSKGWNLYVDGEQQDLIRANYVLRAALIPAGNHELEMRYEPKVWAVGEKVSLASSLLLILVAFGIVINAIYKRKKAEA
ncbi:MAG: YfhO family protein, partial [Bacteroidales bacterium]|nr:YfhO family protein [Bacteroidales bacterium]